MIQIFLDIRIFFKINHILSSTKTTSCSVCFESVDNSFIFTFHLSTNLQFLYLLYRRPVLLLSHIIDDKTLLTRPERVLSPTDLRMLSNVACLSFPLTANRRTGPCRRKRCAILFRHSPPPQRLGRPSLVYTVRQYGLQVYQEVRSHQMWLGDKHARTLASRRRPATPTVCCVPSKSLGP